MCLQVGRSVTTSARVSSAGMTQSVGGVTMALAQVWETVCPGATPALTSLTPALLTSGSSPAVLVSRTFTYFWIFLCFRNGSVQIGFSGYWVLLVIGSYSKNRESVANGNSYIVLF